MPSGNTRRRSFGVRRLGAAFEGRGLSRPAAARFLAAAGWRRRKRWQATALHTFQVPRTLLWQESIARPHFVQSSCPRLQGDLARIIHEFFRLGGQSFSSDINWPAKIRGFQPLKTAEGFRTMSFSAIWGNLPLRRVQTGYSEMLPAGS